MIKLILLIELVFVNCYYLEVFIIIVVSLFAFYVFISIFLFTTRIVTFVFFIIILVFKNISLAFYALSIVLVMIFIIPEVNCPLS